ncbi:MAG: UDP-N-acetylmuramate--L-alanine ligase [Bacilli bacterium]|nr:UDP-N-acetylmuramate--L-alanine ligase [Bacilli bacterium]
MKYYCIGIKGTGMSTLAQILHDLGNEVSGYDDARGYKFTQKGLEEREIPIYYDQNHEISPDTIVTYSVAFSKDHPEIKRVESLGLRIVPYHFVMGKVVDMFQSIGVSGTHGKTTTSSLIKHILENNGGCNYFIGAGDGYATLDNSYFVVESDEFNRHFTAYHPKYSVITNIEAEHLECYKDIDDIRNTFQIFANQTEKLVVANGDNLEVRKINCKTKMIYYGFGFHNDAVIKNVKLTEEGSRFDLYIKEELYGSFEVNLYGKHMVSDVCAAILICRELGISKEMIIEALKTFQNAKRRFAIEKFRDTIIVDDYAHHPTEIKVTLEAVRQKYPDKRIVVVFKPNTYSRTRDFKDEFVDSLKLADKVYLTQIDCNREREEDYPGVTSQMIINEIEGAELISEGSISKLKDEMHSVICFMGCAYVDSLIESLKILIANSPKEKV